MSDFSTNLPLQLTSFVGRELEMAEVKRILCSATARLVTLTGAGGCGKTRFALQVAADLLDSFPDGVWLIELAPLADPALVSQALAAVFEVRETSDCPLLRALTNYFHAKNLLLVLDNCEHLLDACARLSDALLRACPHLRILATSRESLGILGETTWRVPSLTMPDVATLSKPGMDPVAALTQSEAARLFVDRALAALPSFRLTERNVAAIAQICHRLDGMPLALELAAARVKALSVEQIAAHLDDCFQLLTAGNRTALPRHQTLHATIDWSYNLLTEEERVLFRRLAVFAGGWTLPAVERICSDETIDPHRIIDLLSRLVDKSLVSVNEQDDGVRYHWLETMRQYALQMLLKSGEMQSVQSRHFTFFLNLAERAESGLRDMGQSAWFKLVELERDNFRAALEWSLIRKPNVEEIGLRLVVALCEFWIDRNYWKEGREWVERALKTPSRSEVTLTRERALGYAFEFAIPMGEINAARMYLQERSKLVFALQDEKETANLMLSRAVLARLENHLNEARSNAEESLKRFTDLGDKRGIASALSVLGAVERSQGDEAAARAHFEESLRLGREIGDSGVLVTSVNQSAFAAFRAGDFTRADALFKELLALSEEREDKSLMRHALVNLGEVARSAGNDSQAKIYYEASLNLARELSAKLHICCDLGNLGYVALHQGDYYRARELFAEDLALYQEQQIKWGVALVIEGFARLAAAQDKAELAAQLLGAINPYLTLEGGMTTPADRIEHERTLVAIHSRLDDEKFNAAWEAGSALSLEQAAESALTQVTAFPMTRQEIVQAQVEPELCIFALGSPRVCRGERELAASDWKYAKTREMFFYLLCHPSRTKEQIGVVLWQDASDAQLRSNFRVALYHLRHALGRSEWILFEDEKYTFNRALPYWFDVDAFEQAIVDARSARANDPPSAIRHLQSAIDLYQGEFLAGANGDWFCQRQLELQREYLDALLMLGELHFAQAQYSKAVDAYRKAIAADNLLETAHRELMRCYARLGERGQALRHYQELVELLREEIGAAPASETQTVYAQLRQGKKI